MMDLEFIKRIEQRGTAEIVEYPDDALLFCFAALEKIEDLQEALKWVADSYDEANRLQVFALCYRQCPCHTEGGGVMDSFFAWLIGLWATGAWLTHVIVCLQGAKWGFLIAGALMFPIAIVHGTGVWFGAW